MPTRPFTSHINLGVERSFSAAENGTSEEIKESEENVENEENGKYQFDLIGSLT